MIKTFIKSIREFKTPTILTLLFIIGEVFIEVLIPFRTADLVNGIQSGMPMNELLRLGLIYARTVYRAQRASLGVFENNIPAQRCYRAAGFRETDETEDYPVLGETWKCVHMAMDL